MPLYKEKNHIGGKIAHLLIEEQMEKNRLAELLGLKRHQVYSLLKNESIDFKLLLKICIIFKKPITYFINFEEVEGLNNSILGIKNNLGNKEHDFLYKITELQEKLIYKQEELCLAKDKIIDLERRLEKNSND